MGVREVGQAHRQGLYYTTRKGFEVSPDGRQVILALTTGTFIIDVETGEATTAGFVSGDDFAPIWQRLAP